MNPVELYSGLILWIGDGTGAPDTVLHIHAGMAVLLVVRVISRRSLATFVPLSAVYLAEAANEVMDYLWHGSVMPDTLSDVVNTVFWPTVLFIGLRARRLRAANPEASRGFGRFSLGKRVRPPIGGAAQVAAE